MKWRTATKSFATKITASCDPVDTTRYHLRVSRTGDVSVLGSMVIEREFGTCIGRLPAGLRSADCEGQRTELAAYLARHAHLEAASVVSFERLARELAHHGAPAELVALSLEARADEVRHAHIIGSLAERRGAALTAPEVAEIPIREQFAIALENAVEGCVRETFGALLGGYQAEHAEDSELRACMRRIAADEARHAALAQRAHRFLLTRLSPAERAAVVRGMERAVFELAAEVAVPMEETLRRTLGLPPPHIARRLLTR